MLYSKTNLRTSFKVGESGFRGSKNYRRKPRATLPGHWIRENVSVHLLLVGNRLTSIPAIGSLSVVEKLSYVPSPLLVRSMGNSCSKDRLCIHTRHSKTNEITALKPKPSIHLREKPQALSFVPCSPSIFPYQQLLIIRFVQTRFLLSIPSNSHSYSW